MKILALILSLVSLPLYAGVTGGTGPRALADLDPTRSNVLIGTGALGLDGNGIGIGIGIGGRAELSGIDLGLIRTQGESFNLKPASVKLDDYRRARARLSTQDKVSMKVEGQEKIIKNLDVLLSDQGESIYLLPIEQN